MSHLVTDLDEIKNLAAERETENDAFRVFLKNSDGKAIDTIVHQLNDNITPKIDCTACGNCCKSLMINVTKPEAENLAAHLQTTLQELKEKYIEESSEGQMVVNKIPCHFLSGTKCSIYEHRFEGCREFPHLDRDNFTSRLFGTMMYYGVCPIIFNVVEALKMQLRFTTNPAE